MKKVKLNCEGCGANLEVKDKVAFCPYCGSKLFLDDENRTTTNNYNYSYDHKYTIRNEAEMRDSERKEKVRLKELEYLQQKEENKKKAEMRNAILPICFFGASLLLLVAIWIGSEISKSISKAQGKISAGNHDDYIGEDYEAVVEQFEEMGFENIVTVDLDDAGIGFWNSDKVKSVSIDNEDDFNSDDYFEPDDKVIIKYH